MSINKLIKHSYVFIIILVLFTGIVPVYAKDYIKFPGNTQEQANKYSNVCLYSVGQLHDYYWDDVSEYYQNFQIAFVATGTKITLIDPYTGNMMSYKSNGTYKWKSDGSNQYIYIKQPTNSGFLKGFNAHFYDENGNFICPNLHFAVEEGDLHVYDDQMWDYDNMDDLDPGVAATTPEVEATPTPPAPTNPTNPGDSSGDTNIYGDAITEDCSGVLGPDVKADIEKYLSWVRIIAPILVIVLGMVDYAKAVISDDDKALSKANSNLAKRLIAAIALFFVPLLLTYLINLIDKLAGGCDIRGL